MRPTLGPLGVAPSPPLALAVYLARQECPPTFVKPSAALEERRRKIHRGRARRSSAFPAAPRPRGRPEARPEANAARAVTRQPRGSCAQTRLCSLAPGPFIHSPRIRWVTSGKPLNLSEP